MKYDQKNNITRRRLLGSLCRTGLFGFGVLLGAGYYAKRRRFIREGKCIGNSKCAQCDILSQCGLPLAMKEKRIVSHG